LFYIATYIASFDRTLANSELQEEGENVWDCGVRVRGQRDDI